MERKLFTLTILFLMICSLIGQSFTNNATLEQDFCGRSVLVVMDNNIGGLNRSHSRSLFGAIDFVSFRDLTEISGNPRMLRIDVENYNQILKLSLPSAY